jgi:hypothetical protein
MWEALFRRRYGTATWTGVVRLSGVLGLAAVPVALASPAAGGMVGFALITIWVNGPISPLLPSTYEPILMLFGRLYEPWLVAVVGVTGTIYVEYLNYHVYGHITHMGPLRRMQESAVVRKILTWFERAPFLTVWVCSWSPLPYWPVRFISPMVGYDVRRHLLATFLGRFPRLWFFAALGLWWNVSTGFLVLLSVASIVLALGVWGWRRSRRVAVAKPAIPASADVAKS